MAHLVEVLDAFRLDGDALAGWLRKHMEDFRAIDTIQQFQGGQSNPTYLLTLQGGRRLVLRKKPPGKLLPKAHQVEREYRIMAALQDSPVAVPAVLALCQDDAVLGTPFYVMEHVDGEVHGSPTLENMRKTHRLPAYANAIRTMAHLHNCNYSAIGLGDFGPVGNYVGRQVNTWSKQYHAARFAGEIPAIEWLISWLEEHQNIDDETTLIHGDYRFGNMIYESGGAGIKAVLDWELSTLGHPLSDLAYFCMVYAIPFALPDKRGIAGRDLRAENIPSLKTTLELYCSLTGRDRLENLAVFQALAFFRIAAILHGVGARAMQGNASDTQAARVGAFASDLAEIGQKIARDSGL